MRLILTFLAGIVAACIGIWVVAALSPQIRAGLIHLMDGKTSSQFDRAVMEAASPNSDSLNSLLLGDLSVDAFSLTALKASQVDCRRGVISTLERNEFRVDIVSDEIRFASVKNVFPGLNKNFGEIRGLAKCTSSSDDTLSNIQLSIAVHGEPEGRDLSKIRDDLSRIWPR
jgi:hypothetical protein